MHAVSLFEAHLKDNASSVRLTRNGMPIALTLKGERLSHQFQIGESYLLVTDFDFHDGGEVWLYLISESHEVLDVVALVSTGGFIQEIEVKSDAGFWFRFYGGTERWQVSVSVKPYWSLSFRAMGQRPGRWFSRRYLEVAPCSQA